MTERTFADWVAPVAATLAEDHRELMAFVREQPPEFWDRPSVVDGWTNRDILAHIGGGNDQLLQFALRSVISHKPLGPESWDIDTDAANAHGVEVRRSWPLARVIDEVEEGADETLDLLAQLTDADREARAGSVNLRDFLRIVHEERHDHLHLQQLRASTPTPSS